MVTRVISGAALLAGLYGSYWWATIAWRVIGRPDHLNLQVGALLLIADVGLSWVVLRPFAYWTFGREL